ncbi:tripartite motif-containing protein 29-like [Tachysurus vachellii]|uniref:tripartite motif-containing protein 29-like n=1 Tax=Tachysurus vachellii TaxID=175792 RepID=UPI00296B54C0|nr:tripartite motif-containing protein 29-like [Tachysurus vachellii]
MSGVAEKYIRVVQDMFDLSEKIHQENSPELKINTTLREVADHFKKKSCSDKPEVLCDSCSGEKLKALKSCLDYHKNHSTVPIEEESRERKTQLVETQTDVQQMIQDRLKKIKENKHSVEQSKRSTEKEKADSIEVFTALIRSIERSQAELLEVMEEKQKAAETQAEGLIKELEQEISVLKRRDTELEQLSHTEEHLHLLQVSVPLSAH